MDWSGRRRSMLDDLYRHGIQDSRILAAMAAVPRHLFIPQSFRGADAYGDHPCPIGYRQTISQPYIVAYMSEILDIHLGDRVLEIGTGSGYQAAVFSVLGAEVFSVEIIPELVVHARHALADCGYTNVHIHLGDGHEGWLEHAPYEAILAACAPAHMPKALPSQLKEGGRLIIPVGISNQRLVRITREKDVFTQQDDLPVRFVPMVIKM